MTASSEALFDCYRHNCTQQLSSSSKPPDNFSVDSSSLDARRSLIANRLDSMNAHALPRLDILKGRMTTHASIRSFFLEGPAGRLEALLNVGLPDAQFCAVVAHPHPLYGGTMHNKVVFNAMKALNSFGFPVLRFNFRGVGTSAGEHDYGRGEIDDVKAALNWIAAEYDLPILFAGFSFGAATGMRAACPDPRVHSILALGTPLSAEGRSYTYALLAECSKPKLFLSGDQDQYADASKLAEVVAQASEPKRFVLVRGGDHFFAGHLDEMRTAIQLWIHEVVLSGAVRSES